MFKNTMIAATALLAAASLMHHVNEESKTSAEEEAVKRACLDYVEGVYEVKPELIERGVHPELVKFGFYRREGEDYQGGAMTYDQLHSLAGDWNKDGSRANDESPKEVIVFDVLDKTASAKLVAEWGIDYFHLAKEDGEWKIRQVMWQSPPE
ncbi:MAG: nuclear transport factor 2 family protein [Pirellulaceae bacterium]